MSELLAGYTVVEFAQLVTGSRLGMLLADLGAEVIKIEQPGYGDQLRYYPGQITPGVSPAHLQLNKDKRSLTLDLRSDVGREVFWRLIDRTDVFIDGGAANACSRMGIGFEEQRRRRPSIVYCDISGFGAQGPYAGIPTHSQMMNALAAAYDVGVDEDGAATMRPTYSHPTRGPLGVMGGEAAFTAPVVGAMYVCAALANRTGEACHIDVSATETVVTNAFLPMTLALNAERITDWSTVPAADEDIGAKYGFYRTKDDHTLLFCAIESHFWRRFCTAVGRDDLLAYDSADTPVDYGSPEELAAELRNLFRTRSLAEWLELATRERVPIGPALSTVEELRGDPHLSDRGLFREADHAVAGPYTYLREPAIVRDHPTRPALDAPELGAHTRDILLKLGYSESDIRRLSESGTV